MGDAAKSRQEPDDTAANASSSAQEPEMNTIANASSSTVSKRFSVSPAQVSPAPQEQQPRKADTYHSSRSSSDDHKSHHQHQPLLPLGDQDEKRKKKGGGGGVVRNGAVIRSASMPEHDVALHERELSCRQSISVDHT